jgi:TonB family protein
MFETLLASGARHEHRPMPAMAAAGLHLVLLGTALTNSVHVPAVPDTAVFFLPPAAPPSPQAGQTPAIPAPPAALAIKSAPGVGLPGLLAADPGVPLALPGPGGLPGTGIPGTTTPAVTVQSMLSLIPSDEVEEPATVLTAGRLRYPPALEAAGLAGRVELEFVVDTTGRVEARSLTVLSTTAPEFVEAARAAVLDTRFSPARANGHSVRQLVRQPLVFKVPGR